MPFPLIQLKITGTTGGGSVSLTDLKNVSISNAFRNIGSFFQNIGQGTKDFNGIIASGGIQASGTITLSSSVAADTVTINGTVFTEVASGATGNQFNHGASDTITAANLAAAINASTTANILNNVSATSAAAVVTILSKTQGTIGNFQTIAISAHGSVSGSGLLAGGTDGTSIALAKGL